MPIFPTPSMKNIARRSCLLLLCLFCGMTGLAQKPQPSLPIGPERCEMLKQQDAEAIKAGNGALAHQLGQELIQLGCYDQPKEPPGPPATALHYSVGGVQTVSFSPGGPSEGQSTVLPPGSNAACSTGALLISNDWQRPPGSIVRSRDLAGKAADIVSKFDLPPHPEYYDFLTNDHDLIALGDGSVLYLTGAGSKEPLPKQPAWWNVAWRGTFGPGARSNLMVWRSTDCGATFHYLAEMDPALMEDGSCANPQGSLDSSHHYDMGGSDGQLVKVDPANNMLYLTFRCVGDVGTTDKNGNFTLTTTGLNKTLVATSTDYGASWQSKGFIHNVNWWRFGILPLKNLVAFGFANDVVFGIPFGGKLGFGKAQPLTGEYGGFAQTTSPFNPNPSPDPYVFSNVWGNTVIARAGDSQGLLLSFPTVIGSGGTATNGYSVLLYDPSASGSYSEIKAIAPLTASPANYVMNVIAVDLGRGPILLYWTDVNTASHKGRIRGRIIINLGQYSSDFDITGDTDLTAGANPSAPAFFYGDYHTASGYVQRPRGLLSANSDVYRFYPLWVDRTGGARYAQVTVSLGSTLREGATSVKQLQIATIGAAQRKTSPATVDLLKFKGKLPQMKETVRPRELEKEKR
jgi:hypothetical protein